MKGVKFKLVQGLDGLWRGERERGGRREEGCNSGALAFTLQPLRAAVLDPKLDFESRAHSTQKYHGENEFVSKRATRSGRSGRKGGAWPPFSAAAAASRWHIACSSPLASNNYHDDDDDCDEQEGDRGGIGCMPNRGVIAGMTA